MSPTPTRSGDPVERRTGVGITQEREQLIIEALWLHLLWLDDLDGAEAVEGAVDEEDLHRYVGLDVRLA